MLTLLGTVALAGCGLMLLIYLLQDRLIFYPQQLDASTAQILQRNVPRTEAFELAVEGNAVRLRGWFISAESSGPSPLLIYFGGNAEEVSWLLPELTRLHGWAVLLVNYRGYGLSEGSPSEAALQRDALALYDNVAQRSGVDPERIVIMGRSLGTGVSTYLASQRPVAGVVLVSPFDSLIEVASAVYPFLPVRLLLRHRFESVAHAPAINTPLLALAAKHDTLIAPERSRRLVQAWGGPARLELLDGADHNTIHVHPQYWTLIGQFLGRIAAK